MVLTDAERAELEGLAARRSTAQAMALRARIVLACAGDAQNKDVAAALDVCQPTVGKWRRRFAEHRVEGLRDEPRPGAPRTVEDERIEALVTATLESVPQDATHWSSRGMARASGLSVSYRAAHLAGLSEFSCVGWHDGRGDPHGPTQSALHPRPAPGPAAGWRRPQDRV